MYKFMIIFYQPPDAIRFETHYTELLALVEKMPGLIRRQVVNIVGSPKGTSLIHRVLELYFEGREQMETALLSPVGQRAGSKMTDFVAGSFEIVFAEVYEEVGGQTGENASEG